MGRYAEMDIAITKDGDLIIKDGDFDVVLNADCTAQGAYCRLKSSDPEWYQEAIAANLEDILGKPNSKETGAEGERLIRAALLADDLISAEDLYVQAIPVDRETLIFFVYFKPDTLSEPLGFEVQLNLSAGATVRRVQ